jgi:hypothetical protein
VTLFESHGVPVAVNVGDATKVLALDLLLGNTTAVGVRKALLVFREVERMARESVEGQAIELGWIAEGRFDLGDRDYIRMAYKKTRPSTCARVAGTHVTRWTCRTAPTWCITGTITSTASVPARRRGERRARWGANG